MKPAPGQREFLLPALALFLFNTALLGPLFTAERTPYKGSIEGAFIGLARFLSRHPDPFGWYPYWYGGTPVQFTYTPGLHYLNALAMRLLPWLEPGQVYHAATALLYCLGSVTAAYLVYFFTARRWWTLFAGALWSLWAPSLWLVGEIGRDSIGFEAPWRLQVLVKYGEGPHTGSLLLLPLAVCALWRSVYARSFASVFLSAVVLAAAALINWVGAFALGAVFLCLLLAVAWRKPVNALPPLAAAALAYLLAAFWITPAFVRTIATNAQTVSGHYEYNVGMLWLLAGVLGGLLLIRWFFHRKHPEQLYLCFLALASFFFGYLVLCSYCLRWYMIPQPHRYVPEFELFSILLVCEVLRQAWERARGRWKWPAAAGVVLIAGAALFQARLYLTGSYRMLRPANLAEWPEYEIGRRLNEQVKPEERVFILGSEGMGLNGWFDIAQVKGWFDPGVRDQLVLQLSFAISYSPEGPRSVDFLKSLGARYVVVHSLNARLAYHDFPHPTKFDGFLTPVEWFGEEAVIYEIPGVRLAELVRPEELPARAPQNIDSGPLARYVAAVSDETRPPLEARWLTPNRLEIRGELPAGFVVSLRVSHAGGWRAFQGGRTIPITRDRLGFMTLHPQPDPEGFLRLEYAGELEQRFWGWISFVSWGSCFAWLAARGKNRSLTVAAQ